ncbi:MAG: ATP-binding protein, partial [Candidatus Portnoybacteria bacterium]|nr:ATP-binding protein [Candidatus Portnoybacteria bacterium]
LFLSAVVLLFITVLVLYKKKRGRDDDLFIVLNVVIIFWILTDIIYSKFTSGSVSWPILTYISALFLPFLYLIFSYSFLSKNWSKKLVFLFSLLPLALLTLLVYRPELMLKNSQIPLKFGGLLPFYAFYMASYFMASYAILLKKMREAEIMQKRQIQFVFFGSFIPSITAFVGALILPLFGMYQVYFLSPAFTLVLSIFIAFAIFKHNLFETKLVATELFVGLLSLILFIRFLTSEGANDYLINAAVLVGVTIFGILLLKSVFKEIRMREQLSKASEELQKANEELKKLDKAKSEFISIASHQLRTPLSIIKGYASMLLEGSYGILPDKAKDIIQKIEKSNERLVRLINDLLDISRMEGGRMKFQWNFIILSDLVQSVVEELRPQADKKSLALNWQTLGEKTYVRADEEKLRQVIMNLIDNAIKYTTEGQVDVSIQKIGTDRIRLLVKDTGIGMKKEEIEVLFGKFIRGREVPKVWTEGVGLGLYVAKMIIEEHKGKVWAESEGENKGSTFNVELPVY